MAEVKYYEAKDARREQINKIIVEQNKHLINNSTLQNQSENKVLIQLQTDIFKQNSTNVTDMRQTETTHQPDLGEFFTYKPVVKADDVEGQKLISVM